MTSLFCGFFGLLFKSSLGLVSRVLWTFMSDDITFEKILSPLYVFCSLYGSPVWNDLFISGILAVQ